MRIIFLLLFVVGLINANAQVTGETTRPIDSSTLKKVLIVINGVEQKNRGVQQLDSMIKPDQIESIRVLRDKEATDKYGEKGKDGVLEITLKKNDGSTNNSGVEDVTNDDNIIFTKPEIEASFPGGQQNWVNFLKKNLKASTPINHKAPFGTYTVIIQFVVDRSGKTSEFKALTNHGYGMEEECLRVLKLSPPWIPAVQNGYKVKAYRLQPITFVVAKD